MLRIVYVVFVSLVVFLHVNAFALEKTKNKEILLYKKSIPLMMEIVFEFANDSLKNEVLTLFKNLTQNKDANSEDLQKFTHLLKIFLSGVHNKDKKVLDEKLLDNNPNNDEQIKKVIIPKLIEFKQLLSDKNLRIKNEKKYEVWSKKIKRQITLINSILDMITINENDKEKIRKLLGEIKILIESKKFVL